MSSWEICKSSLKEGVFSGFRQMKTVIFGCPTSTLLCIHPEAVINPLSILWRSSNISWHTFTLEKFSASIKTSTDWQFEWCIFHCKLKYFAYPFLFYFDVDNVQLNLVLFCNKWKFLPQSKEWQACAGAFAPLISAWNASWLAKMLKR